MAFVPDNMRGHPTVVAFQRMREAMGIAKLSIAAGQAADRIAELQLLAAAGDEKALYMLAAFEVAVNCQCPAPGALMPRQMSVGKALARAQSALESGKQEPVGGCAPCMLVALL